MGRETPRSGQASAEAAGPPVLTPVLLPWQGQAGRRPFQTGSPGPGRGHAPARTFPTMGSSTEPHVSAPQCTRPEKKSAVTAPATVARGGRAAAAGRGLGQTPPPPAHVGKGGECPFSTRDIFPVDGASAHEAGSTCWVWSTRGACSGHPACPARTPAGLCCCLHLENCPVPGVKRYPSRGQKSLPTLALSHQCL